MTWRKRCDICKIAHRRPLPVKCYATERLWPTEPLEAVLPSGLTVSGLCYRMRWSGSTTQRYLTHGLPDYAADRLATALRLHPVQVWGWEWIDSALTVTDRQRIASGWRQAWEWAESVSTPLSAPKYPSTPTNAARSEIAPNPGEVAA